MTVVDVATLKVGEKCIDYAGWRDFAAMSALGLRCAGRYISTSSNAAGAPVYSWKSITPAEVAELHRRNIGVIAFWEASGTDPLRGYGKGLAHGQQAMRSLTALGYPAGLPCIAAVDFDVTGVAARLKMSLVRAGLAVRRALQSVPVIRNAASIQAAASGNIDVCAEYVRGFREGLAGRWATGVYGDVDIIKRCAADDTASFFHYAGASSWSHGEFSPLIHLRQRISGSTPNYDDNQVLRDCSMWLPHAELDVPPPVITDPEKPPMEDLMSTTTMVTFRRPERPYDTTDPKGPNPMKAGEKREGIGTGHPNATVGQVHVSVTGRGKAGWLLFWDGSEPRPLAATVNFGATGVSDCGGVIPLPAGSFTVYASEACDIVIDLQGVDIPS